MNKIICLRVYFLTPNQPPVQCQNCNKFGHKQFECRVKHLENTNQHNKQCNFLKKLGHREN